MEIFPYIEAAGIAFGSTVEAVTKKLGSPIKLKTSHTGRREMIYEGLIVRLNAETDEVVEITVDSEIFKIAGEEISFVELGFFIAKTDPDCFKSHGFLVSPKYGLAFDPHHPYFLSLFTKNDLEKWRT